jgi:hypothetical protein
MSNIRYFILALTVAAAGRCCSADESYYRTFLDLAGTNLTRIVAIDSPLLIDTNNNTCKPTNFVVNLADSKATGQLGDVRLGMTMEQVVACWGKPHGIYTRCYGGPRFCYAGGLSVIFEPASNSVLRVLWIRHEPDFPRLAAGLAATSAGAEGFIHVLGTPSTRRSRGESADEAAWQELVYTTPTATLRLEFWGRVLDSLSLVRPAKEGQQSR